MTLETPKSIDKSPLQQKIASLLPADITNKDQLAQTIDQNFPRLKELNDDQITTIINNKDIFDALISRKLIIEGQEYIIEKTIEPLELLELASVMNTQENLEKLEKKVVLSSLKTNQEINKLTNTQKIEKKEQTGHHTKVSLEDIITGEGLTISPQNQEQLNRLSSDMEQYFLNELSLNSTIKNNIATGLSLYTINTLASLSKDKQKQIFERCQSALKQKKTIDMITIFQSVASDFPEINHYINQLQHLQTILKNNKEQLGDGTNIPALADPYKLKNILETKTLNNQTTLTEIGIVSDPNVIFTGIDKNSPDHKNFIANLKQLNNKEISERGSLTEQFTKQKNNFINMAKNNGEMILNIKDQLENLGMRESFKGIIDFIFGLLGFKNFDGFEQQFLQEKLAFTDNQRQTLRTMHHELVNKHKNYTPYPQETLTTLIKPSANQHLYDISIPLLKQTYKDHTTNKNSPDILVNQDLVQQFCEQKNIKFWDECGTSNKKNSIDPKRYDKFVRDHFDQIFLLFQENLKTLDISSLKHKPESKDDIIFLINSERMKGQTARTGFKKNADLTPPVIKQTISEKSDSSSSDQADNNKSDNASDNQQQESTTEISEATGTTPDKSIETKEKSDANNENIQSTLEQLSKEKPDINYAQHREFKIYLNQLEEKYGIPYGILGGFMMVESSGKLYTKGKIIEGTPTKYGTAKGLFQFLPMTAQHYKIDPEDPIQAAEGAAKLISEKGGTGNSFDLKKAVTGYYGKENYLYEQTVKRYQSQFLPEKKEKSDTGPEIKANSLNEMASIGDSISEGFSIGGLKSSFYRGYASYELNKVFGQALTKLSPKPKSLLVYVGLNDATKAVGSGKSAEKVAQIFEENMIQIINNTTNNGIQPLLSMLYIPKNADSFIKETIIAINKQIQKIGREKHLPVINFEQHTKALEPYMDKTGHLKSDGYKKMIDIIKQYMKKNDSETTIPSFEDE